MWSLPLLALLMAATAAPEEEDPLLALLQQDHDPARLGAIEELLRSGGGDECSTLAAYARARDARARENAVRTMGDLECSGVEDYRPYFSDGSAWVADALLDALSRNRVEEGVPYALAHIGDRRRLVSDGASGTLAQEAHRALRTLTAQPIPSARQPGMEGVSARTEAAWRAWYAMHRDEPETAWIASGLESMRASLAGNSGDRRLDALETAALIGEPGRSLLAGALRREPSDLAAALSCAPDEAPRVTDEVPCVLTIRNASTHRVALAPGEIGVKLAPWEPPSSEARVPAQGRNAAPNRSKTKAKAGPRDPPPPADAPKADPRMLGGRLVDLGPGESLRREVRIGPVGAAGRYEAKVELTDLWGSLDPGPYQAPPIEAALVLRFEQ